jgi:hypothetical protein
MAMLRSAALAFGLALAAAGSASAELVARGVQDGMLSLGPKGTPYVAYVRSGKVVVAHRAKKRWRAERAAVVGAGWQVRALETRGSPIVLAQSRDLRRIVLLRRVLLGWQTIRIAPRLPAGTMLGWPGLALDRRGNPVVAYVRWTPSSFASGLVLARVNARGRVRAQRITVGGFPPAYLPPAAEPLLVGSRVHVIESFGWRGSVGTYEWYPQRKTWVGLGLDVSRGDWPLGPVLAARARNGLVYAAWTESMLGFGFVPVTLAVHRVGSIEVHSEFVLDRALTTALALPSSGPEIAANEWVDDFDLGRDGDRDVWAGVVRGAERVELGGWIAGLVAPRTGGRDVLLALPQGLSWFHSGGRLGTHVTIAASGGSSGVTLSGTVDGVSSGSVRIYRESPGAPPQLLGTSALSAGAYAFLDRSPVEPLLYRAVFTDPRSGIPYAALLRPADDPSGGATGPDWPSG